MISKDYDMYKTKIAKLIVIIEKELNAIAVEYQADKKATCNLFIYGFVKHIARKVK